jgi:hypothetical protein
MTTRKARQRLGGVEGLLPTLRDETAKDGAPGFLWLREGKRATADPPFDFAQGRLFRDDNKKGNGKHKGKGSVVWRVYFPPFAMRLRRMGHPVFCGWGKEKGNSRSPSGMTTKGQGDDKS